MLEGRVHGDAVTSFMHREIMADDGVPAMRPVSMAAGENVLVSTDKMCLLAVVMIQDTFFLKRSSITHLIEQRLRKIEHAPS